ncbi:MAG: cytidylate kinase family protein [Sediminibacterium sp.]|nr:cytidylate kinase family protein [Sediminibacterium sp.]
MNLPNKIYHITITGDLGSGKSTVATIIAEKLQFHFFSTGELQRQLAAQKNLDTLSLNKLSESDRSIDQYIDNELKKINDATHPYVIDSRLAWHFIQFSFKVFLRVNIETGAERILSDSERVSEQTNVSLDDKILAIKERKQSENKRFFQIYGIKCSDMDNYDFIIDSTNKNPEEISDIIITSFKRRFGIKN